MELWNLVADVGLLSLQMIEGTQVYQETRFESAYNKGMDFDQEGNLLDWWSGRGVNNLGTKASKNWRKETPKTGISHANVNDCGKSPRMAECGVVPNMDLQDLIWERKNTVR